MKKPFSGGTNSIIDRILILLIACFVFQLLVELATGLPHGNGIHFKTLALSSHFIESGFFWAILSYPFLNQGPIMLIMNLIGIHFICRAVEHELGKRNFYWLCSLSTLSGGLIWLTLNYQAEQQLCGFTPILMASLTYFCFSNPDRPINLLLFFVLPISIKPRYLLLSLLGIELFGFVFWELRGNLTVNCSAHLGGMLSGAFVFRYLLSGKEFPKFVFVNSRSKNTIGGSKPFRKKQSVKNANYTVDFSDQQYLQEEVDRILDKINENGFGALTQEEKNILEKAKGLLNRH